MTHTMFIAFYGDKRDDSGMPVPYHPYQIFMSLTPEFGPQAAVATIMSLGEHATSESVAVGTGAFGAALEAAKERLRQRHHGLHERQAI